MRKPPLKLSVVFSFRNEADVLPELVRRTRHALHTERDKGTLSSHELIFVNDCSTDNSLQVLMEENRGYGDIRVITMSRCFGVSECVLAGME